MLSYEIARNGSRPVIMFMIEFLHLLIVQQIVPKVTLIISVVHVYM